MKKAILAAMLILAVLALSGCQTTVEQETEAETEEEAIPQMSIDECLKEIKEVNPDMTEQAASDNCWIIEAVNKQDSSLCNKVSESFKSVCLAQFE